MKALELLHGEGIYSTSTIYKAPIWGSALEVRHDGTEYINLHTISIYDVDLELYKVNNNIHICNCLLFFQFICSRYFGIQLSIVKLLIGILRVFSNWDTSN